MLGPLSPAFAAISPLPGQPGLMVCGRSELSNVRLCPPPRLLPPCHPRISFLLCLEKGCKDTRARDPTPGHHDAINLLDYFRQIFGMNCVSRTQKGGFLGGSSGKEPACQCRRSQRRGFNPWVRKMPWRRAWQPTPVFLPGESYGQRSQVGYSPLSLLVLTLMGIK